MSNTSATGGYLQPSPQAPLPGSLTFKQFLQQVFVGVSGLPGELVRPSWQPEPPKQPDSGVNWLAIALKDFKKDTNSFIGQDSNGNNFTVRQEDFFVDCTFYGPDSQDFAELVCDNFQINQNLEALKTANMDFVEASDGIHVPDLVNELWIDRYEVKVRFRRQVQRVYPILTFASSSGSLKVMLDGQLKTIAFK